MHTLHKLLFAKHCTCYCVCLWSDQPSFANTLNFVQNWFDTWKFMENVRNFKFGKFGLQFLFLKIISSHTQVPCGWRRVRMHKHCNMSIDWLYAFYYHSSMFWKLLFVFYLNWIFLYFFLSIFTYFCVKNSKTHKK